MKKIINVRRNAERFFDSIFPVWPKDDCQTCKKSHGDVCDHYFRNMSYECSDCYRCILCGAWNKERQELDQASKKKKKK